jgi:uncharacterized membrane protein (DUF441 family)
MEAVNRKSMFQSPVTKNYAITGVVLICIGILCGVASALITFDIIPIGAILSTYPILLLPISAVLSIICCAGVILLAYAHRRRNAALVAEK